MIFLVIILSFYSSTLRDPIAASARAPSAVACEAKAAELRAKASADSEVEGYSITCVTVPTKT